MTTTAPAQSGPEASSDGEFRRQGNRFTDRITTGAADGWPVQAGRYRLVWSRACPWAHRARIVLGLLGLDDVISLATVDPIRDDRGWRFTLDPGGRDPVLDIAYLSAAYLATDPSYEGRVTVPCIVDVPSGRVVTNDVGQITLDLSTQWRDHHRPGAPDLYPEALRHEIDSLNADVYRDVNNGVYRAGFAASQQAYERAYTTLWDRLDALEDRLSGQRYLVGDSITEADVRLFTTIVRFDAVYHGLFKCNRNKITEMPALWGWARDMFQTPGFGDTVDFNQIRTHYYATQRLINPSGIVPVGPDLSGWRQPSGRERRGG